MSISSYLNLYRYVVLKKIEESKEQGLTLYFMTLYFFLFFAQFSDQFQWVRPQSGCVGFVNYLSDEPIDSFCERLVKEYGILLMPASVYDYDSNHCRIGFGRRNMPEVLALFESVMNIK